MSNRTLLYVIGSETTDAEISSAAETAATEGTHLACQVLGPAPALPIHAYGVPPYGGVNIPDNWAETVEDAHAAHRARAEEIEKLFAKANVSADIQPILCVPAEVRRQVARRARVCDMALIAESLRETPDMFREAVNGVMFHSPIGLLLNTGPALKAGKVFIAWDSSEGAAKAVHAALPLLLSANEVTIGCFDPVVTEDMQGADPGADLAAWLSHHGCRVTVSQFPSGGREIADCILDRGAEMGADLVVMGAYGRSQLIETVFGGTTHSMLKQRQMPVLLGH